MHMVDPPDSTATETTTTTKRPNKRRKPRKRKNNQQKGHSSTRQGPSSSSSSSQRTRQRDDKNNETNVQSKNSKTKKIATPTGSVLVGEQEKDKRSRDHNFEKKHKEEEESDHDEEYVPPRHLQVRLERRLQQLLSPNATTTATSSSSAFTPTQTLRFCEETLGLCVACNEWDAALQIMPLWNAAAAATANSTTANEQLYRACLEQCLYATNAESALEIWQEMQLAMVKTPCLFHVQALILTLCRRAQVLWRLNQEEEDDHNKQRNKDAKTQPQRPPQDHNQKKIKSQRQRRREQQAHGYWRKAWSVLKDYLTTAPEEGLVLDPSSMLPRHVYHALFQCWQREGQWQKSLELLHLLLLSTTKAIPPNLVTHHYCLQTCVQQGQVEQAYLLLQSLLKKAQNTKTTTLSGDKDSTSAAPKKPQIQPTSATFEIVMSGFLAKWQWRRALTLLNQMEETSTAEPTIVAYNMVISACAKARQMALTRQLHQRLLQRQIKPDLFTYNALLAAAASVGRWKDALELLAECQRDWGLEPDIITYTNAMRAYARGGQAAKALSLLDVIKAKGLTMDTYCYTATIDACAKGKKWQRALELLEEMQQEAGLIPNEITYGAVISACANGGQWEKALDLLKEMKDKNKRVNIITYNSALNALAKACRQVAKRKRLTASDLTMMEWREGGTPQSPLEQVDALLNHLWKQSLQLMAQIKADGLSPDVYTYSSVMSVCGAAGRYQEAIQFLQEMRKGGIRTQPNSITYTAAIAACGKAGKDELALKLFQDMKREGISPDRVTYNAVLSAIKMAENSAELSYQLWNEMCSHATKVDNDAENDGTGSCTPDIITLTEVLYAQSRPPLTDTKLRRADEICRDAVERWNLLLRQDSLDSTWEVDFSGLPFPVARAACRYVVHRAAAAAPADQARDLTIITGMGKMTGRKITPRSLVDDNTAAAAAARSAAALRAGPAEMSSPPQPQQQQQQHLGTTTALREYIREVLRDDFTPPIFCTIPEMAKGTVVVKEGMMKKWMEAQSESVTN